MLLINIPLTSSCFEINAVSFDSLWIISKLWCLCLNSQCSCDKRKSDKLPLHHRASVSTFQYYISSFFCSCLSFVIILGGETNYTTYFQRYIVTKTFLFSPSLKTVKTMKILSEYSKLTWWIQNPAKTWWFSFNSLWELGVCLQHQPPPNTKHDLIYGIFKRKYTIIK